MNYVVTTKTFTQISETSGTIQNASRINAVEISNQAVKNTGDGWSDYLNTLFNP